MKNYVRAGLAAGAAVLALGTFASSASAAEHTDTPNSPAAAERAGTPDEKYWYIGSGNAYGSVTWDDNDPFGNDMDNLTLRDDVFPSGYSVKMTVRHGSWKETVHATSGGAIYVHIPDFKKGEKANFSACAWDNGDLVKCRARTTITE